MDSTHLNIHETFARLVSIALKTPHLSVLREMMLAIADSLDGYGCALWQREPPLPGAHQENKYEKYNMVAIAAGFRDPFVYPEHDLPQTIPSAVAMREGEYALPNFDGITFGERAAKFLQRTGIKSLCSVSVQLEDGKLGALTVYRQRTGDWSRESVGMLKYLAVRIPLLHSTVRDRVSFQLLDRISTIFSEDSPDSPQGRLEKVCEAVADGLQCLETAIFLEYPLRAPGVYERVATTCAKLVHREKYMIGGPGLTPWVAARGPIAVPDVLDFERSNYDGLTWTDEVDLENTVRKLLAIQPNETRPPVSFMAVPVVIEGQTRGVIRCCAARGAPFYFAHRETQLLTIIGSRIGHYWGTRIREEDLDRELRMWQHFVGAVGAINKKVQRAVTLSGENSTRVILKAPLETVGLSLESTDYVDLSLFNSAKRELILAAGDSGRSDRRMKSMSIDGDPSNSLGARLFVEKRSVRIHAAEAALDPIAQMVLAEFPDFKHAIYSPILIDGKFIGVIAVRGASDVDYPQHASQMLELLGHLTGLYYQLQAGITRQTESYLVFSHQLRSPIFQAQKRAQILRSDIGADSHPYLDPICGLLGKARRLVINVRLFANLVSDIPLSPDLKPCSLEDLVRPLIELASDNRILWQHHQIAFHVATETFEFTPRLAIDVELFVQVAGNILDNFGKYGKRNSRTVVGAAMADNGGVVISFRGRSLHLSEADALRAGERGWRGKAARIGSSEGAGIGLWMARHIMHSHSGELIVLPTDSEGYTEIRIVFPGRE